MPGTEALSEEELFTILRAKVRENYPETTEPESVVRKRADKTKPLIAKYLTELNSVPMDIESSHSSDRPQPKVVLVSHNGFLSHYKGVEHDPNNRFMAKLPNCQFISDPTDYSKVEC